MAQMKAAQVIKEAQRPTAEPSKVVIADAGAEAEAKVQAATTRGPVPKAGLQPRALQASRQAEEVATRAAIESKTVIEQVAKLRLLL